MLLTADLLIHHGQKIISFSEQLTVYAARWSFNGWCSRLWRWLLNLEQKKYWNMNFWEPGTFLLVESKPPRTSHLNSLKWSGKTTLNLALHVRSWYLECYELYRQIGALQYRLWRTSHCSLLLPSIAPINNYLPTYMTTKYRFMQDYMYDYWTLPNIWGRHIFAYSLRFGSWLHWQIYCNFIYFIFVSI